MSESNGFTPVQKRLLKVVEDGQHHPWEELWKALEDDLSPKAYVLTHVTALKKKLASHGETILGARRVGTDGVLRMHYVKVAVTPSSRKFI